VMTEENLTDALTAAPIHEGRMLGGIGQVDGPRRPQLWLRL
jgi:hypothetical protein